MTVSEPEDTSPVVDGSVLASEETRTRRGALRAVFFALVVFIAIVALMPNKTGLTWTLLGIYTAAAVALLILIVATRHRAYGDGTSTVIGLVVVVLVLGSCVYFGLVGGPTVILPAIVYYYGLGDSKTRRRVVAAVAILGYLALSALVVLHVVPPTGMIPSEVFLGGRHVIFTALSVATLLVVTYWLSSRGRRNTLLAMAELERARRGIRQRDALLHEARDDLDRAVAGARMGRLTGRSVDGYVLDSVIGRGAVGEVYRATKDGAEVAFKVLLPHMTESDDQVARFFREAQIIAALSSPHIPRLFASGVDDDGAPYLALELLHGADLGADLRQRKSLTLDEVDTLVQHVCLALHAAHEAGVVHRDIKPPNLFLTADGVWKVLDFGVSTMLTSAHTLTQGGAVGTPSYMAPEQALGKNVDRRADVFSLGAVMYRVVTGRPAFTGTTGAATMYAAVHAQPIRPSDLADVPSDVDAVLALALAKDPERRIASAEQLAEAWRAARHQRLDDDLRRDALHLLFADPWDASPR